MDPNRRNSEYFTLQKSQADFKTSFLWHCRERSCMMVTWCVRLERKSNIYRNKGGILHDIGLDLNGMHILHRFHSKFYLQPLLEIQHPQGWHGTQVKVQILGEVDIENLVQVGSFGIKSSDTLAAALFFELKKANFLIQKFVLISILFLK